jgi:apolipoprotein D and lipocalin family protein
MVGYTQQKLKNNYALVTGKNLKYLWILSRETNIPEEIKDKYLNIAEDIG